MNPRVNGKGKGVTPVTISANSPILPGMETTKGG